MTESQEEAAVELEALAGYQRKFLRARAHDLQPLVQVGRSGITEGVVESVEAALFNHELIKVRLHRPEDKKGMAQALADRSGAQLCGLVGHTAILYKRHPDKPVIVLPKRREPEADE